MYEDEVLHVLHPSIPLHGKIDVTYSNDLSAEHLTEYPIGSTEGRFIFATNACNTELPGCDMLMVPIKQITYRSSKGAHPGDAKRYV